MFQIIHEYMFPESKMESYEPIESTKFYYFALKRADDPDVGRLFLGG